MALGGATTLLTLCCFPERMAPWYPNSRPPATPGNHFGGALRNPALHRRPSLAPWRLLWLLLMVLLPLAARAQPDLARQATELAVQTRLQWAGADIAAADLRITSAHTEPSGLLYAYAQQLHAGIPVYNQVVTLVFKDGKLRHHAGRFLPARPFAGLTAVPTAAAVVTAIAAFPNPNGARPKTIAARPEALSNPSGSDRQQRFAPAGVARRPIEARLVWVLDQAQQPHLAWNVNVAVLASADWLNIRVDAATG